MGSAPWKAFIAYVPQPVWNSPDSTAPFFTNNQICFHSVLRLKMLWPTWPFRVTMNAFSSSTFFQRLQLGLWELKQTSMRAGLLHKLKSADIEYLWFIFTLMPLIALLRMLNQLGFFLFFFLRNINLSYIVIFLTEIAQSCPLYRKKCIQIFQRKSNTSILWKKSFVLLLIDL